MLAFDPITALTKVVAASIPVTSATFAGGALWVKSTQEGRNGLYQVDFFSPQPVQLKVDLTPFGDATYNTYLPGKGLWANAPAFGYRFNVWDIQGNFLYDALATQVGAAYAATFTKDGSLLVTGGDDGTPRVFSAETGAFLREMQSGGDRIQSLEVSPDQSVLAAGMQGEVKLYNLASGQILRSLVAAPNKSRVERLKFSHDSKQVFFAQANQLFSMDVQTGVKKFEFKHKNAQAFWTTSLDLSGDSRTLISGDSEGAVTVWDTTTGQEKLLLKMHNSSVQFVKISQDGLTATTGDMGGKIYTWNVRDGKVTHGQHLNGMDAFTMQYDPVLKRLVTTRRDKADGLLNVFNLSLP